MNRRRFLAAAGGAVAAAAGATGYGALIEPRHVEFPDRSIPSPGPATDRAITFAQISDLHVQRLHAGHERIVEEIADRAPDFLVFTGDTVDDPAKLPLLDELLSAIGGVAAFAILGNWEYWGGVDPRRLAATFERWNGTLLVNRSVEHEVGGVRVRITGLDDLLGGRPDPSVIHRSDRQLLLAHCPAQRDRLVGHPPVDCVLSGHTHGGQISPFGFTPVLPRGSGHYVEGWYGASFDDGRDAGEVDDHGPAEPPPLYVSRGIGMTGVPVRLGAPPEVAFFRWTPS